MHCQHTFVVTAEEEALWREEDQRQHRETGLPTYEWCLMVHIEGIAHAARDTLCGHAHRLIGEAIQCAYDTCPEGMLALAGLCHSDGSGMTPYESLCCAIGRIWDPDTGAPTDIFAGKRKPRGNRRPKPQYQEQAG